MLRQSGVKRDVGDKITGIDVIGEKIAMCMGMWVEVKETDLLFPSKGVTFPEKCLHVPSGASTFEIASDSCGVREPLFLVIRDAANEAGHRWILLLCILQAYV